MGMGDGGGSVPDIPWKNISNVSNCVYGLCMWLLGWVYCMLLTKSEFFHDDSSSRQWHVEGGVLLRVGRRYDRHQVEAVWHIHLQHNVSKDPQEIKQCWNNTLLTRPANQTLVEERLGKLTSSTSMPNCSQGVFSIFVRRCVQILNQVNFILFFHLTKFWYIFKYLSFDYGLAKFSKTGLAVSWISWHRNIFIGLSFLTRAYFI